mgnify:CR=1 FL=1
MSVRVGINGLGRIGRTLLRLASNRTDLEIVALNDVADPGTLAHLVRHDSVSGRWDVPVEADGRFLRIRGKKIRCTPHTVPSEIPWGEAGVEAVVEATGLFETWRLSRGDSRASIGVYRASKFMRTRVITIPWYYRVAGPMFRAINPVVPLPRIPRPGGTIAYTFVYNHLAGGPEGLALWRELLGHANNTALDDGADLLTGAFDPADRFFPDFARGALNRIDYRFGMRWLAGDPPPVRAYYVDPRDMS